jgi:NAD(P)-dependent dehydrogenase (short-subunit alcohol dehydrogenase family)
MTTTGKLVALVIGASRGIGRQVAIDLAKNHYAGESVTTTVTAHVWRY